MAAIDLGLVNEELPVGGRFQLATTWQEFTLDTKCRVVTVANQDAAIVVRFAWAKMGKIGGIESPADAGAVGTHYEEVPAGTRVAWRTAGKNRHADGSVSIFVAAASGTPWCSVGQEVEAV